MQSSRGWPNIVSKTSEGQCSIEVTKFRILGRRGTLALAGREMIMCGVPSFLQPTEAWAENNDLHHMSRRLRKTIGEQPGLRLLSPP